MFGRYVQGAKILKKFRVISKGERGELPIKYTQANDWIEIVVNRGVFRTSQTFDVWMSSLYFSDIAERGELFSYPGLLSAKIT